MKHFYFKKLPILLLLLILSCNQSTRLDVDVSSIECDIRIKRFEQDLFGLSADSLLIKQHELYEKYGAFYKLYVENVLNAGKVDDPTLGYSLKLFVSDYDIKEIYKKCNEEFAQINDVEKALENAFKHYKYYYPDSTVPEIVTYISGFEIQNFIYDSLIGVGLDMYLGEGYRFYNGRFPLYQQKRMSREYIATDCMRNWLSGMYYFDEKNKNLLDHMIYHGKILYLVDAMMPSVHDTIKIGYTEKQLEWCNENEFDMWAHFVNEKVFYSSDAQLVRDYINPSPFTKGFPKGSPGRAGVWLGWQITRAYMENNPKTSIHELMKNKNSQEILNKSKYKPNE